MRCGVDGTNAASVKYINQGGALVSSKIRFIAVICAVAALAFASQAQSISITDPGMLGLLGLGLLGVMLAFRPVPARRRIRHKDR